METLVRTPQTVFMLPQRLIVPLFQRPYVWSEEGQWEPLWEDVTRVADRLLATPHQKPHPHFLGAVVLQHVPKQIGLLQERTIIDGQQRLTTLQLLLDALHAEMLRAQAIPPAMRLEQLIANSEHFCSKPEDRFKVWPTNRDRPAFHAVMGATPPIDYDAVGHPGERMVEAHRYFSDRAEKWLSLKGSSATSERAEAIDTVVRDLLQVVVIELGVDENAQEIFETLNARGSQLTAADLIKNFIFQRLQEAGTNVEDAYQRSWKDFETGFWETEVGLGRIRYPRSALFLNHWLVARTGDEVVAREVFSRFKAFALDSGVNMAALLPQVQRAAEVYRGFVADSLSTTGAVNRLALFAYRTGVMESEVIKPLILCLLDPEQPPVPAEQLHKALDAIESWMVRRMLVRATTKSYSQLVAELVRQVRDAKRAALGDTISGYLAAQASVSRYWPDDEELRRELLSLAAYRRLSRGRLRMVLEAVEDHQRGWRDGKTGLGGQRVARGTYAIEHIMPRKWVAHWGPCDGFKGDNDRDRLIHTIGNLTLLTGKLNAKVSNGPWLGEGGKRQKLQEHDVLLLNRTLLTGWNDWTDQAIRDRTAQMADLILQIWPVPQGHRVSITHGKSTKRRHKVDLADLIGAGLLTPGPLFPCRAKHAHHVVTLLSDGQVDVDGAVFSRPSQAASSITGKKTGGWWFFLVNQAPKRSLRDVRREYWESLAGDADEDLEGDGDEEDGEEL